MAKTPIQLRKVDLGLAERLDNVVESSYIDVPNTTIVNRAQIRDFANDLRPRLGVERLATEQLIASKESGIGGRQVFKIKNDLFDQMRFVGDFISSADEDGNYIENSAAFLDTDYTEITFYGTGLNILARPVTSTLNVDVDVDGSGSGSFTIFGDAVLNGRNYSTNQIWPVVSGLSQGLHTIKLTGQGGNTGGLRCYGFEILNESTTLDTTSGVAYKGADRRESALDSQAYDSNFEIEEGTPGTKGGHVSVYQDIDGSIKKAIRWTETSQLNLSSADHSNEELIRSYNWHEFGAGRSDDFSSVISTPQIDAAFTLNDGTTSLVGQTIRSTDGIHLLQTAAGDFYTFTFVGTGLDVISETTTGTCEIFIDGNSVGNFADLSTGIIPVVSGLPYGTHTVKFSRTNAADFSTIKDFLVYGPKKPTLPADAVELGDYFLMADFVTVASEGIDTIGTGVLRKSAQREFVYSGTWAFSGYPNPANVMGVDLRTSTATDFVQYTFFGTGIVLNFDTGGGADFTIDIDGTSDFSGVTTNLLSSGNSFNASTGTFTGNAVPGASISISGLSLGLHTFTMTSNASTNIISALDIITPIHTPSFDTEIEKQQIVGASGGGIRDQRQLVGKATLKTRAQQIEDGEIIFNADFSGFKPFLTAVTAPVFNSALARPYKSATGEWRLFLQGSFNHASDSDLDVNIPGIIFGSAVTVVTLASHTGSVSGRAFFSAGLQNINCQYSAGATSTIFNGDLPITGKPSWAV